MPPRPGTRRSCPTGLQCEHKHQLTVEFNKHTYISLPSPQHIKGLGKALIATARKAPVVKTPHGSLEVVTPVLIF